MNDRIASSLTTRLVSLAIAAACTLSIMAGIGSLARVDNVAQEMAQVAAQQGI
jgi:hypothetical protein